MNQLNDFSLLSLNSFLNPFFKSKFKEKTFDTRIIELSKSDLGKSTTRGVTFVFIFNPDSVEVNFQHRSRLSTKNLS